VADGGVGPGKPWSRPRAENFVTSRDVPGPLVRENQRVDARWGLLGASPGAPRPR